jgi:hypothetical protein
MSETEPLLPSQASSSAAHSIDNTTFPPSMAAILDKIEKEVNDIDNSIDSEASQLLTQNDSGDDATLYDKKCLLVDRQIDAFGMGRYQWMIFALCGLGYLIDLMWAQAFGLVLSPLQQELGFGNDETGKLSTAFSVGLTAGAFVWGILVDVIGRRWAFNLTVLIACIFGLCLGAPDDYNTILVVTSQSIQPSPWSSHQRASATFCRCSPSSSLSVSYSAVLWPMVSYLFTAAHQTFQKPVRCQHAKT